MGKAEPTQVEMGRWEHEHEDTIDRLSVFVQNAKLARYDLQKLMEEQGVPEPLAKREAEKARP